MMGISLASLEDLGKEVPGRSEQTLTTTLAGSKI